MIEFKQKIELPSTEITMDGGKGKGSEKPKEIKENEHTGGQHTTGEPRENASRKGGDNTEKEESGEQKAAGI